jgi:8-oxo-dGTP diphosphatase
MAVRVLAAVIQRSGSYLVCRRPPHKRHGGLWEFPGGKVEPGETDFEAARRELAEELGVTVIAVRPPAFSFADPGSPFVIDFVPVVISGEPERLEHSDMKWMTLDEMHSIELAPSDLGFSAYLRRQSDFEQPGSKKLVRP